MNITEMKNELENIIHDMLYVSDMKEKEQKQKLKKLIKDLNKSDNYLEDLRNIISLRNNENYFMYENIVEEFLKKADSNIKIEILNNQFGFEDLFKKSTIFVSIWNTLDVQQQIWYLEKKKKYSKVDYQLINESLKGNRNFKENKIFSEIFSNEKINKKIEPYTINLNYSFSLASEINLSNLDKYSILTKETYTTFLLKKCKTFSDFLLIYESNNRIYNSIDNNSLIFPNKDNEEIYKFILGNNNFIGKFNIKYLDLFNILELNKISSNAKLAPEAYVTVIQKLYKFDNTKANIYFNEKNLNIYPLHSISIYPFHDLNETERNNIFNNYQLFNRFLDTIMIEAINNYFSEDDIVSILRNDSFVEDISSYALELLLNKLSFKSSFNMLQRKNILNKISNLNIEITENDMIFVKGFLDSPSLINISDHAFVYNMLNLLNSADVKYYIYLPYIYNKISNYEVINLCLDKNINLEDIINSDNLKEKLNVTDIIKYIDECWKTRIDLNIFLNKDISKIVFNLSDENVNSIDFNEVNYLFETIRMKSVLSKQNANITVKTYKSVLVSYLVFGLDKTLKIVSNGNADITLDDIKNLQKKIVNERILIFKKNNSAVLQNMPKKIVESLNKYDRSISFNDFNVELKNNTYLDNIVYLMLDNNYDNYNKIMDLFYAYVKYHEYDEYHAKKEIYDYANSFIAAYINNKATEYNKEFEDIILNNFKPKENVIYSKRKQIGKEFINKLKLKLFIRALTDNDKTIYVDFFEKDFDLDNIKNKYIKFIADEDVDFESILEHVLIPLSNDRYDSENCLDKLGIAKPQNYDEYYKYMEDLQKVTLLNQKISELESNYDRDSLLSIMNYICYKTKLIFKEKAKNIKEYDKYYEMVNSLDGELYVDKSTFRFLYKDNIDIYNIEEIIEYKNYMDILENIITKTTNYINRHMNQNNIKNYYSHDYFKIMNDGEYVFPISNKYYELKRRVFSLVDIEYLFNGYNLSDYKVASKNLMKFLLEDKNIVNLLDGYYGDLINNMGVIIYEFDNILDKAKELDIDINDIDLLEIEDILSIINCNDSILGRNINKEIIKSICDNCYYEDLDINKRINKLINLYEDKFKCICSSIPFISYEEDNYLVEIVDKYDQNILLAQDNSLYRVGALGNDFLHYAILNKNGLVLHISKDNKIIAKLLGVRNGNTVYLNQLEGLKDDNYITLLKNFANKLINCTKDDIEPIEFVTIVNNELFNDTNGLKLDSTICPFVNNPVNTMYADFDIFKQNENLLNDEDVFYTNYKDNITTLLANSIVVDKNNFKYYDADDKYYRNRNSVLKLSNNINDDYLTDINVIMDLYNKQEEDKLNSNIILSSIDTIYLGDDFVVFITKNDVILQYVLNYDERAKNEVNLILESL